MAVARPLGFEIDFARNPIFGSAACFFVIILKVILKSIIEIPDFISRNLRPLQICTFARNILDLLAFVFFFQNPVFQ